MFDPIELHEEEKERSDLFNRFPNDVMELKMQLFAKEEHIKLLKSEHNIQVNFAKAQALKIVDTYIRGQFYEFLTKTLAEEPQLLDIWSELFAVLKLTRPDIEDKFKEIIRDAQGIPIR